MAVVSHLSESFTLQSPFISLLDAPKGISFTIDEAIKLLPVVGSVVGSVVGAVISGILKRDERVRRGKESEKEAESRSELEFSIFNLFSPPLLFSLLQVRSCTSH